MSLKVVTLEKAVETLENWFTSRCDGDWENKFGVTLQTTDNPGWWLTLDDFQISERELAEFIGELMRVYGAQITSDGMSLRIFSRSLSTCIIASAIIVLEKGWVEEKVSGPKTSNPDDAPG